ncbi:MAG TPA: hypothetical protein VGV37_00345 [Aliidongia sp.]|uniref:hypothetical protein n=1 Tax=Aliidongia sp. TaxID=1914230 RepID=UPI002DDCEDD1|nr:hypothetical protein [Aliidongia sp.]HEV2672956.1 hypothetical protein [Aliidongia sp.]
MRNTYFDRSKADRRHGMRRATVAAWTVVVALFAIVFVVPTLTGAPTGNSPSSDRAISRLVARAVPPDRDICQCTEFDHLEMTAAPSLC